MIDSFKNVNKIDSLYFRSFWDDFLHNTIKKIIKYGLIHSILEMRENCVMIFIIYLRYFCVVQATLIFLNIIF